MAHQGRRMLMGQERLGRSLGRSATLRAVRFLSSSDANSRKSIFANLSACGVPTCAVLVPFHAAIVTCPSNTQYLPFTACPQPGLPSLPLFSAHWRSSPARGFCQFIGIHSPQLSWFRLVHNLIRSELVYIAQAASAAQHCHDISFCAAPPLLRRHVRRAKIRTQRSNPSRCALRIARNDGLRRLRQTSSAYERLAPVSFLTVGFASWRSAL